MIYLQNPSVELFGLRIDEPVTTFTDLLIAIVGIVAYKNTASDNNDRSLSLYRLFFLFTGISTLVAAFLGHAFAYKFGFEAKFAGWILGALGVAFAQFAVIFNTREIFSAKSFLVLILLNTIEIIAITVLVFVLKSFVIIEIHSAFGLVVMVTVLESINYYHTKSKLSKNMIYGVVLAIVAVICHIAKLAVSNWFNHLDISHLFMAAGLYVMYKGVCHEQKLNLVEA